MNPTPFGTYTLIRRLGKGGMAEVFLARCPTNMGFEKLLAIKRLLSPYNIDKQIIAMLADEARISVWLNHPNIVQVLDFGLEGSTYYLAIEYVDGCDLCDLIRPGGKVPGFPLPLSTVLYIFVQLADALDYAHSRKNLQGEPLSIIHRDVSPHNVLISREGQVKLADFGLARASISVHHSREGVVRGKFSYMPKEQALGLTIDHRIDLFALGVSMYEALTGKKPYTATNLAQQLYQLEHPVPPPSAIIEGIPEEIDDITLQAMNPEVAGRYTSAEDLARDLRHALSQRSTFSREAEHLAGLVSEQLGYSSSPADPRQVMSLSEIKVSCHSLIHSEIETIQQHNIVPPPPGHSAPEESPTGPPAPLMLDLEEMDEGDATAEYRKQQTPDTAPPPRVSTPPPDRQNNSMKLDGVAHLINTHDTVRDPEAAGHLAKEALREHYSLRADPPTEGMLHHRSAGLEDHTHQAIPFKSTGASAQQRWRFPLILLTIIALTAGAAIGWLIRGVQSDRIEQYPAGPDTLGSRSFAPSNHSLPRGNRPRHQNPSLNASATATTSQDASPPTGLAPRAEQLSADPEPLDASTRPDTLGVDQRLDSANSSGLDSSTGSPLRRAATRQPSGIPKRSGLKQTNTGNRGLLSVEVDVPAKILFDDQKNPLLLPLDDHPLAPGIHRLRVIAVDDPGISVTRWVVLQKGDRKTISINLMQH